MSDSIPQPMRWVVSESELSDDLDQSEDVAVLGVQFGNDFTELSDPYRVDVLEQRSLHPLHIDLEQ
jgi:hypothetical protein